MLPSDSPRRFFLRFFLSYLLVFVIPLSVGSVLLQHTLSSLDNRSQMALLSSIREFSTVVEGRIEAIEDIVFQIDRNPNVIALLSMDRKLDNEVQVLTFSTIKGLPVFNLTQDALYDFLILFRGLDMGLSQARWHRLDSPIAGYYLYDGLTVEELRKRMLGGSFTMRLLPETTVADGDRSERIIPLVQSLPVGFPKSSRGVLIAMISASRLEELLLADPRLRQGTTFLLDETGSAVARFHPLDGTATVPFLPQSAAEGFFKVAVGDTAMGGAYVRTASGKRTYVSILPYDAVVSETDSLRFLSIAVFAALMLLGLAAATTLALRTSKPLSSMASALARAGRASNASERHDLFWLESNVADVAHGYRSLRETLERQGPFIATMFYERLLKGGFRTPEEMEAVRSVARIDIPAGGHHVLAVRWQGEESFGDAALVEDLVGIKSYLHARLSAAGEIDVRSADIDVATAVFLVTFAGKARREPKETLNALLAAVRLPTTGQRLRVGVGTGFGDLFMAYQAYAEALFALDSIEGRDGVVWYADAERRAEEFFFPLEIETRMVTAVNAGDARQVEVVFALIEEENLRRRRLSPLMKRALLQEIHGAYLKLPALKGVQGDAMRRGKPGFFAEDRGSFEEGWTRARGAFLEHCRLIDSSKKSHNTVLKESILAFLGKEYPNPLLCLALLAERFQLNEAYLSHFIKEQTGTAFSDLVENLRLDRAAALLQEGALSVVEISSRIGYSNCHSFRRAFKRRFGVPPHDYRPGRSEPIPG